MTGLGQFRPFEPHPKISPNRPLDVTRRTAKVKVQPVGSEIFHARLRLVYSAPVPAMWLEFRGANGMGRYKPNRVLRLVLLPWLGSVARLDGEGAGGQTRRMPGAPDAQLLIVDPDHLQDDELRLAFGATMLTLPFRGRMVMERRSESH